MTKVEQFLEDFLVVENVLFPSLYTICGGIKTSNPLVLNALNIDGNLAPILSVGAIFRGSVNNLDYHAFLIPPSREKALFVCCKDRVKRLGLKIIEVQIDEEKYSFLLVGDTNNVMPVSLTGSCTFKGFAALYFDFKLLGYDCAIQNIGFSNAKQKGRNGIFNILHLIDNESIPRSLQLKFIDMYDSMCT